MQMVGDPLVMGTKLTEVRMTRRVGDERSN